MGDDGSDWTEGYLQIGDFPTFKLWDASQNLFYPVEVDVVKVETNETFPYTGWFPNDYFNVIDFHALVVDCSGVLDGGAYFDTCGDCVGGITGIEPDLAMDCNNDCFGSAFIDNCGACSGGQTGIEPNLDDLGCGCFLPPPADYYSDFGWFGTLDNINNDEDEYKILQEKYAAVRGRTCLLYTSPSPRDRQDSR